MDEILMEQTYKVLVRVDDAGHVVAINSSAFYLASALIVGGKILSFGCIASTGVSILDHQTRALNNPPNGYCVMTADNFESISVYTYGDAFPAGSQLVVAGC